jgi:membrane carboxypeptidase/penicillin-binding protein PbpC
LIGFGTNSILKIDRAAAVKTGTTTNFHDNWTIGYTPDLLVGVWVGNSDYQAMHDVTGLTGAAPIWHEVMRSISQGRPDKIFQRPDGLIQVEVCALSGLLPTDLCPHVKSEWFINGTQPTTQDTFYKKSKTGLVVLDIPIQAQAWARAQGLPLLADESASGLILTSPTDNTTYRITPTLDLSAQQILVSATADPSIQQVTFYADGVVIGTSSSSPYQAWWKIIKGKHRFWAVGMILNGQTIKSNEAVITVVE